MKRWPTVLLLLWSVQAFAQSVPIIRYDSVPNALKLPPNMYLGEAAGVAVNSKKHIFVFSRGAPPGRRSVPLRRNYWSLVPTDVLSAKSARICTRSRSHTQCA